MAYTVKQLADLAGVSVRTLHYYDEIELLAPASVGENGYRRYDEAGLLRLQQILFFRQLDFRLDEIKAILDRPDFDLLQALQGHRAELEKRSANLERLIRTVDLTIARLKGELNVSDGDLFVGFDEEKQAQYAQEARRRWGSSEVDASAKLWSGYSAEKKTTILSEGEAIRRDLQAAMSKGPTSPEVQQIVARWHQHLRYFYEPSIERLRGLGQLYVDDPDFRATYSKLDPKLPEFFRDAIAFYCKGRTNG
ncbi:MAG: MerR family transcriptional regulator [Chloroflexi bacterium]|nr:MerR family transcriptional regulator [Chloroflexota bacterium]